MTDSQQHPDPSPGIAWLAKRTGRRPQELVDSSRAAASVRGDLVREAAGLAARLASSDPATREAAQAESEELRGQIAAGPSPGETFGERVAEILRDAAERLDERDEKGQ